MKKTLLTFVIACCFCGSLFAQKTDTITTASGLKYFFTKKGDGPAVPAGHLAICDYILTLTDGTKIDASRDRGVPFAVPVPSTMVIKGFNEALTLMHVGDRGIFILPYNIAYGEKGTGPIPPKSTLIFDIELLDTKAKSLSMVLDSILFKPVTPDSIPHMAEVLAKYRELKKAKFEGLYVSENDLNTLGYELIKKYPNDAVELFKLNVKMYPKSFNVYDSLGEGYMTAGNNKLAIKNYQKSLKLNPKNTNATDMIKKMETPAAKP